LLLRDVLRPCGAAGLASPPAIADVRSRWVAGKLVVFFAGILLSWTVRCPLSPARRISCWMTALSLSLGAGLVVLMVRDLVSPIPP